MKNEKERKNNIFVFFDAANLWEAQKIKGRFIDYEKILKYIKINFQADSVKVFYYTAYPANGTRNYSLDGKHKFYTFLKKGLGFQVRKKQLKRIKELSKEGESVIEKGNMDVELVIDAMYHIKKYDIAIFFTGDSDFLSLITHLKKVGKKVYIFSSKKNISEELRTGADGYKDILNIENDIWGRILKNRK